jgi:putative acetyltransferase
MIIRRAQPVDIQRIYEIHMSAISELCQRDYAPEQINAWTSNRTPEGYLARIQNFLFFVAEIGGIIVGFARYSTKSKEFCSLYVDPAHIRQGIATALVQYVFKDAQTRGLDHMWLDSSLTAVPSYISVGFQAEKNMTHRFQGVPLECSECR